LRGSAEAVPSPEPLPLPNFGTILGALIWGVILFLLWKFFLLTA
jgi:hypothetical protein